MLRKQTIEHNLNFYVVEQDLYEPEEIFYERMKYITSNLEKDELDILVKKSKIISNKKIYNFSYNSTVENIL